jgi:hypothetical protein
VVPITTVTLGYPADEPDLTDRLPLQATVHFETYQPISASDIDNMYFEKENSTFYNQFVAENNKETLAQVFAEVRYSKTNNEFFTDKFLEVLKNQGFLR